MGDKETGYSAPVIAVVLVEVESGFANSFGEKGAAGSAMPNQRYEFE